MADDLDERAERGMRAESYGTTTQRLAAISTRCGPRYRKDKGHEVRKRWFASRLMFGADGMASRLEFPQVEARW
jgi:hypothetical protein